MVIAEKQLDIKLLLHAVGADRSPNLGERQLRFLVSEIMENSNIACRGELTSKVLKR